MLGRRPRPGAGLAELRHRFPRLTAEAAVAIVDAALLARAGAPGALDRVLDACLVADEADLHAIAASYGVDVPHR